MTGGEAPRGPVFEEQPDLSDGTWVSEVSEELTKLGEAPRPVRLIWVDDRHGHILCQVDGTNKQAVGQEIVFADLGPVLHLWSYQGGTLTPAVADELGQALVAWAAKKRLGS